MEREFVVSIFMGERKQQLGVFRADSVAEAIARAQKEKAEDISEFCSALPLSFNACVAFEAEEEFL